MLQGELLKLKRSWVWVICFLIPLLSVIFGGLNFARNQDQLDKGWESLSAQASLFYALIFFSVGSAVILSTVWREDLKKNNWNAVLCSFNRPWLIFAIKALVGALLIVVMHLVFLLLTVAAGWVLRVHDISINKVIADSAVVLISAVPLAVFQSLISYLTRSYSWPIGIGLVLCVSGFAVVSSESVHFLIYVLPQALAAFAIAAPSAAFYVGDSASHLILDCSTAALIQTVFYFLATVGFFSVRRHRA